MSWLRSVGRSARLVGYFAWFGVDLLVKRPRSRPERAEWLHTFCATVLRGMGIALTVEGEFPARGAVISNHLGYADIVVFAALRACVFCSKAEIQHWPVLGWMTTMAGTVYVDRGRGGSALKAKGGMQAAADAGLPVVFFPEGTTTNGTHVLPFHSGLLAQAMLVKEPVTAAWISYTLDEPNEAGVTVADDVSFWGETPMLRHMFRFLGLRGIHAHVRFGAGPIRFSADGLHRKAAAVEAREAVVELGGLDR